MRPWSAHEKTRWIAARRVRVLRVGPGENSAFGFNV